jgi:hypothetical protein
MSANMPDSPTHFPSGSEPLLAKASPASTACQASTMNHPSAARADSHRASYKKTGLGIAAALLLATPLWLYAKPDVVVMLAEQLWSCF